MEKKKIDDDEDWSKAKKKGDHGRGENLKNALSTCAVLVLRGGTIIGSVVITILVGGVIWHWFKTQDYPAMVATLKSVGIGVGGYFLAYFRYSGIRLEN